MGNQQNAWKKEFLLEKEKRKNWGFPSRGWKMELGGKLKREEKGNKKKKKI